MMPNSTFPLRENHLSYFTLLINIKKKPYYLNQPPKDTVI